MEIETMETHHRKPQSHLEDPHNRWRLDSMNRTEESQHAGHFALQQAEVEHLPFMARLELNKARAELAIEVASCALQAVQKRA
jgi:hypothetical protein